MTEQDRKNLEHWTKQTMTPAELNTLNQDVALKVMGWTSPDGYSDVRLDKFNPAESPADALAVLKKLLEKPQDIHIDSLNLKEPEKPPIKIWGGGAMVEAPTLETAICQFAAKLFQ